MKAIKIVAVLVFHGARVQDGERLGPTLDNQGRSCWVPFHVVVEVLLCGTYHMSSLDKWDPVDVPGCGHGVFLLPCEHQRNLRVYATKLEGVRYGTDNLALKLPIEKLHVIAASRS